MAYPKSGVVVAAVFCSTITSFVYAQSAHVMVSPADLKWAAMPNFPCNAQMAVIEGPMNEGKPFVFRLKFPADCKVPPHYHPAIEHVTVISGTLNMGTGDAIDPAKSTPLPAGAVAIMPTQVHHYGWTTQETIIQIHGVGPWGITYVNPADDPAKKTN
jgi:quercetin dioxygenase-like cupin family protein